MMKLKDIIPSFLITCILNIVPTFSHGQDAKTHSGRTKANTPEAQWASFKLADGFVIELVASERDSIVNPIDLTFDDAGRLWTQTAKMYPLDPVADIQWNDLLKLMDDEAAQKNHPNFKRISDLYQGKTKGVDNIIILSDLYGGKSVKSTIWASGLTIPMSILPYKEGAYVAQGSELFFLNDQRKQGKADSRTPLLTGFGFTDTHTMAHTLVRGPGDWIHFSHGALNKGQVRSLTSDAQLKVEFSKIVKFSLDAKKMEVVNAGLNNIWGFQMRHNGQWFGSEANDLGYSVVPLEPRASFPGIGNEKLRPYQPFMPALHAFRVGGTGISGTAFADDASGSFPDEYKHVAFLANPITSSINAVKIVRNPDGSISSSHLPDLLTTTDDWFRPVNIEFGPDGCLYIADWYNKIVSHNELPTTHPDRDKTHGRIWRIRHVSQKTRDIPNFYEIKTAFLPTYLKSPSLWEKRAAWHQISDRPSSETTALIPELLRLLQSTSEDEISRIHALWSLESIKYFNASTIATILTSDQPELRREVIRSLNSYALSPSQIASYLKEQIEDPNPAIRSQVLNTLYELNDATPDVIDILVRACKPELTGNQMGGSFERNHERYLARMALEKFPKALQNYLQQPESQVPASNLLWATQALPTPEKENAFLFWWPKANITKMDESTFVSVANMLQHQQIYKIAEQIISAPDEGKHYLQLALNNQSQVQSAALGQLLEIPAQHLLQQNNSQDIDLALLAIDKLGIRNTSHQVHRIIEDQTPEKTLQLALKALEISPQENEAIFLQIAQNQAMSFDIRTIALNNLLVVNPIAASQLAKQWIPTLESTQKQQLTTILSSSPKGSTLLLQAFDQKIIDESSFNISSAEKVLTISKNDPRGQKIMALVKKNDEAVKKTFNTRLAHYMNIATKKTGKAQSGKMLFQTCLLCHQVGNEGQNIAPALDGSASRENEALLTALLDPDAAVESGYAVFRVYKKDGSQVEGYLVKKEEKGTTIALMGGSKIFIESAFIKSQQFLGGRSFMPKGLLDTYSDQQVADLLTYIRTLK
jgi:putative membrane-bound dehydrogenase-like protein